MDGSLNVSEGGAEPSPAAATPWVRICFIASLWPYPLTGGGARVGRLLQQPIVRWCGVWRSEVVQDSKMNDSELGRKSMDSE